MTVNTTAGSRVLIRKNPESLTKAGSVPLTC